MHNRIAKHLVLLLGWALWLAAPAAHAQAQQTWLNGNSGYIAGVSCVNSLAEYEIQTYASYYGTNNASFPLTGDVTYVAATAGMIGNACAPEVVGFDFFLPRARRPRSAQGHLSCASPRDSRTATRPRLIRISIVRKRRASATTVGCSSAT